MRNRLVNKGFLRIGGMAAALALLLVAGLFESSNAAMTLLAAIDQALLKSDTAYDLRDAEELGKMAVGAAEHNFDSKLVPLTSFGIRQGTGAQQVGMELRKETELGTSLSYGFVGTRVDDSTGYVVDNTMNAKAYVRVSQGLFRRWGSKYNLNELSVAELRHKEQEILAERGRQTLIINTVQRYYEVVLASQLVMKAGEALDRNRKHLEAAKARQSVGLVSKVDVYRAELAVLDAEASRDVQLRQQEKAVDAFRELLGMSDSEPIQLDATVARMVPVMPESWEEALPGTRLDWQANRVVTQIADLEIYKAEKNTDPDIGLSFTVEQKGEGDTMQDALDMNKTNWSIQLQMLSPFDTFNERATLARKKIEKAKQERAGAALQRKILKEAKGAFLDLLAEEKRYQLTEKKLHEAELALDLAKTRYEKGLSENLEVLGAEAAYSEAGVNIARSLTACNLAAVSVAYTLGVLDRSWVAMALEPLDGDTATKKETIEAKP